METLKVGVVGLRRGRTHLRNFLALENAEVVGAADRLEMFREPAEKMIAEAGSKAKVVDEYDQLLEMMPDAVVIATNGKMQVEHACQALEAGCHVFSEVPGAYTFEEVVRLRDTVERTGRVYMFAENACFSDYFRYWRKWVQEGRFGPISLAEAEYVHYLPETLWAEDGSRMRPTEARGRLDVKPIWRADQPPIQYLTHDLGPLLEVLDDRVVSVSCRSGPWWSEEAPLRSDGQYALYETAKGSLIRILVTLNTYRPSEHRYRIFGTDGGAEHFSYEGFTRRFDRSRTEREGWEKVMIARAGKDDDTSTGHGGTDYKTARTFTEAVLEGKPSPIDVYRMAEYSLPGIVANQSAELGGASLPIPNLRRGEYTETHFWNAVPLPDDEPETMPYKTGDHHTL